MQNLIGLSHFFNKYALKIDEKHHILGIRLFTVGLLAIPAVKEYYNYIVTSNIKV